MFVIGNLTSDQLISCRHIRVLILLDYDYDYEREQEHEKKSKHTCKSPRCAETSDALPHCSGGGMADTYV
jgi:hypothetical protein